MMMSGAVLKPSVGPCQMLQEMNHGDDGGADSI